MPSEVVVSAANGCESLDAVGFLSTRALPPGSVSLHSFLRDRFERLTPHEQAKILADAECGAPGLSSKERVGALEALRHSHRVNAFERMLSVGPEFERLLSELLYTYVFSYQPAFLMALNVLLEGGTVGILTARGNREGHGALLSELEKFLGYAIPLEKTYFVNDEARNKRLRNHSSTSSKKLQVLLDHLNGWKADETGKQVPMPRRFEKVLFIDDEDKNIHIVADYLAERFLSQALPMCHVGGAVAQLLEGRLEKAAVRGVKPQSIFRGYRKHLQSVAGDELGKRLVAIDADSLCPESLYKSALRKARRGGGRRAEGTLLMLDIDGTLANVDAYNYVRDTRNPSAPPLLKISQEDWAEHPQTDFWTKKAAAECRVEEKFLFVDFSEFRDPKKVTRAVRRAIRNNDLFRRM